MSATSFKTVASFETAPAAWIHRNYLAQNGLSAIVTDEHTVNVYWLYSSAIGGVKVQIPESEMSEYRQLVGSPPAEIVDTKLADCLDSDLTNCPKCDSIEISIIKWPKRLIFLIWLVLGFPIPIYAPILVCNECGFRQRSVFEIPKQFQLALLLVLVPLVLWIAINFGVDWLRMIASPSVR